jgi:hypothetical protein
MNRAPRERIHVRPARRPEPMRQRARRFRRRDEPPQMHLTQRDIEVLEALAVHRFLSGEQLRLLVFGCSGSRTRRRLRALFDHGFVERISVVAQPTRGIPPFLYALTARGAEALDEVGVQAVGGGGGASDLSPQTVRHRLIVNDVFIAVTTATRNTRYSLRNWRHEQDLKLAGDDGRGRAEQIQHPSLRRPTSFLPDAFFELDLGDGSTFAFFVEVDLATHAQRVWRERALLYTAYADPRTGLFRRRFGRETFRLLIVTTPDFRGRSRRDNILHSIHQTIGPSPLFLATTLNDLREDRILGGVWRIPGGNAAVSLLSGGGPRAVVVRPPRSRAAVARPPGE